MTDRTEAGVDRGREDLLNALGHLLR